MAGVGSTIEAIYNESSWLLKACDKVIETILSPFVDKIMEGIKPIVGDHEQIAKASTVWTEQATQLETARDDHGRTATQLMATFDGQTATAYGQRMSEHAKQLETVATNMKSTAQFLDNASREIKVAEDICKAAVQMFLEIAIPIAIAAVANTIWTLGISDAIGAGAIGADAAIACARVADASAQLATKLNDIKTALETAKESETGLTKVVTVVKLKNVESATSALKTVRGEADAKDVFDTVVKGPIKANLIDLAATTADKATGTGPN